MSRIGSFAKDALGTALRLGGPMLEKRPSRRGFLIPGYTGLGNMIMKTPFIRELRRLYPDARIDVLCGNPFGTEFVLKKGEWIDEILMFPIDASLPQALRFYAGLRGRYDTVFLCFDTAHVEHLYYGSALAGIAHRVGHVDLRRPVRALHRQVLTRSVPLRLKTHEIDLNFDLLEAAHEEAIQRSYSMSVQAAEKPSPELAAILDRAGVREREYVVLQLSAANGAKTPKIWPEPYFADLIRLFLAQGSRLLVLGDAKERPAVERILKPFDSAVHDARIIDLAGRTSVPEAALLIRRAKGIICHDSGLLHMADALGTPLVGIFGAADFWKTHPHGARSHVIRTDLPCNPCVGVNGQWDEAEAVEKCPIGIQCMRDIHPDQVLKKANEVFG